MKSFSVLTVSKRTGWEQIALESIKRQPVKPDKYVVVTEEELNFSEKPAWLHVISAPPQTNLSNLNASNNAGLRLIDSDYVIFYQDFIELAEDCFEKILALANERTFVTTCTPNYDGSDDGRYTGTDLPRPCRPEEWEENVGLAPMNIIKKLGGYDERLDSGWAWNNALLARKAAMLGAKFICDESNRPRLFPHEMSSHETLPKNGELCERIVRDIRSGKEPLDCGCL